MNTSKFMDKQIMDLSGRPQNNEFIDLMNPQEEREIGSGGNGNNEDILPNYDFQPIRPVGASQSSNLDGSNVGGSRVWTPADSKTNSTGIRSYGSLDSAEPAKVIDVSIISDIDRTMKKHADNMLHALEGVSNRLSQLETRTRHLENSVDDLKVSVGNNHGTTDGKMRQLENILREVQTGVQDLRDKQEIVEAQVQLAKLHIPKVDQQTETHNIESASAPPPVSPQPPFTQPQQNLPPQVQFPQNQVPPVPHFQSPGQTQEVPHQQYQLPPQTQEVPHQQYQLPQTQEVSHQQYQLPPQTQEAPHQQYQLPPQTQEAPHQQYQLPSTQQQPQLPPPATPHQQYQPQPSYPQYSQPPPPPPQQPPPPPPPHHSEETSYIPSQNYTPALRGSAPPSQPFYGPPPPSHIYEPPSGRSSAGFSSGYGAPTGPTEPYPYGSGSTMKPPQLSPPGYPQLPTARMLPHALPTATGVSGGSGSSTTGNRVPIDDVVDKVTNMGFPRELVRGTVRKLTENGQAVDLNVVLDKLMNDGEVQPPKGWFGRS